VESILEVRLTDAERLDLHNSAASVRQNVHLALDSLKVLV
jgi:malate dehydrogenase